MALLRATYSHVLSLLVGIIIATSASVPHAGAQDVLPEADGIMIGKDASLQLSPMARRAPSVVGEWARYGLWDAPSINVSHVFQAVRVRYQAETPAGTASFVALRASQDGRRWTQWQWNVPNGGRVVFDGPQRFWQYRAVLLANGSRSPGLSRVRVLPEPLSPEDETVVQQASVAPTYRLRVTRQGMVGGRTANGHRITRSDMFVSLPSWRVLSSRNGEEYKVRLSANGKSVVVPVMDVGPWNHHDNFWDNNRERYQDLPVGWPEDHAAFYEGYNKRRAEKGYVRYPTAVDVADGAYWALGLKGAQATVDITFLWQGTDPGPNPEPLNPKPSARPVTPAP